MKPWKVVQPCTATRNLLGSCRWHSNSPPGSSCSTFDAADALLVTGYRNVVIFCANLFAGSHGIRMSLILVSHNHICHGCCQSRPLYRGHSQDCIRCGCVTTPLWVCEELVPVCEYTPLDSRGPHGCVFVDSTATRTKGGR